MNIIQTQYVEVLRLLEQQLLPVLYSAKLIERSSTCKVCKVCNSRLVMYLLNRGPIGAHFICKEPASQIDMRVVTAHILQLSLSFHNMQLRL